MAASLNTDPIVRRTSIGYVGIVFRTSQEGEGCLDTSVTIGGEYLCTICDMHIDQFIKELGELVSRFEK